MKLGTLTTGAGVETVINLNYLPQYIYFIAATALTGIKVNVAGAGVITDLDSNGIAGVSGIRRYGAVANSYMVPLADGKVENKVVTMTITNSASQTPIIYGYSLQFGSVYVANLQQTILASSGTVINKFASLAINSMATTDQCTISFQNGLVQDFVSTELLGVYTLYSNETDSYVIDNIEGNVSSVKLIPSADRKVIITKYIAVG